MDTLYVRDLMTPDPFTVGLEDDLATVYELMETRHVRHIPVVGRDGALEGLVSQRDLARTVLGQVSELPVGNQLQLLRSIKVDQVMQREVESIDPNADLRDAGQVILDNKFGCLPVVEGDRLAGILTEADFVRYLLQILQ